MPWVTIPKEHGGPATAFIGEIYVIQGPLQIITWCPYPWLFRFRMTAFELGDQNTVPEVSEQRLSGRLGRGFENDRFRGAVICTGDGEDRRIIAIYRFDTEGCTVNSHPVAIEKAIIAFGWLVCLAPLSIPFLGVTPFTSLGGEEAGTRDMNIAIYGSAALFLAWAIARFTFSFSQYVARKRQKRFVHETMRPYLKKVMRAKLGGTRSRTPTV